MQFEWALKHIPPRNTGGIINRIKKLEILCNKKQWTTKSPLAKNIPLNILWIEPKFRPLNFNLPKHITET